MIIEVLDSSFKKIDIIRKYTFAQYTECFRDIGTFKILIRNETENLYLLDSTEQYYFLFDSKVLGRVDNIEKSDDSEYDKTIEVSGQLAIVIFNERIVENTFKENSPSYVYVADMIKANMIESKTSNRNININITYDDAVRLSHICTTALRQTTGGYVWETMKELFDIDSIGCFFYPNVVPIKLGSTDSNIESFEFVLSAGVDRRKGNNDGNVAVVFSQSISNISRTDYKRDTEDYKNVAYIAGEGSGNERKWYTYGINEDIETKLNTGWGRRELWIDARDIQSQNDDGSQMSAEEYQKLLKQRAVDRAKSNTATVEYEATLIQDRQYVYSVDYKLGDWVTVLDNDLGVSIDAQVVSVTTSITNDRMIYDVTLSYGKTEADNVLQMKQLTKRIRELEDIVKYLESKVGV